MMSNREYMVYYVRVSDDSEIEMRMCVEAGGEDEAIVMVRNTLRGRVCWMRAEMLQPKHACKSER